jgi:hypothetical protein
MAVEDCWISYLVICNCWIDVNDVSVCMSCRLVSCSIQLLGMLLLVKSQVWVPYSLVLFT